MTLMEFFVLLVCVVALGLAIVAQGTAERTSNANDNMAKNIARLSKASLELAKKQDDLEKRIKGIDSAVVNMEFDLLDIQNIDTRLKRIEKKPVEGKHAADEK